MGGIGRGGQGIEHSAAYDMRAVLEPCIPFDQLMTRETRRGRLSPAARCNGLQGLAQVDCRDPERFAVFGDRAARYDKTLLSQKFCNAAIGKRSFGLFGSY